MTLIEVALEYCFLETQKLFHPEDMNREDWNRYNHLRAVYQYHYESVRLINHGRIDFQRLRKHLEEQL